MLTLNQLIKNKTGRQRSSSKKTFLGPLQGCPQKKGVCVKVFITTPKKPNSAQRKVSRVRVKPSTLVTSYIPGEGHSLQEHSVVLIRGGNVPDLPGVKFKNIRGKYDFQGVAARRKARSKYGTKKVTGETVKKP